MSARKGFSRSLYNESDSKAKKVVQSYLESTGHTITNSEENYHADLESTKDGKTYYHEAEMKFSWKGDWNPTWEEIRIPHRKQRLLDKYEGKSLTFYVIRNDKKFFWKIPSDVLRNCEVKEAKNRYISKGEEFFHIKVAKATLVNAT
jgi:hypothetical protein